MPDQFRIVGVGSPEAGVIEPGWLMLAEEVHRQLRPDLPAEYAARMTAIIRGGASMSIAAIGERVAAVVVYRFFENSLAGLRCYVDDLVTAAELRSAGAGRALLRHVELAARARGCRSIELESGVQRAQAHRFYLGQGFAVTGLSFKKAI